MTGKHPGAGAWTRRRFVQGLAAGGVVAGLGLHEGAGAQSRSSALAAGRSAAIVPGGMRTLAGERFELSIGESMVNFTGSPRPAITVNSSLPAPLLRWREGTTVELLVSNRLPEGSIHGHETSIHWHGILLPANMDGVPGISFNGIGRGETYRYHFDVRKSGTYWYHSHSAFQEQAGLYGALIIDPEGPE